MRFLSYIFLLFVATFATYTYAGQTSEFQISITDGVLSIDVVDDSFDSIASPTVAFADGAYSLSCETTTGTYGSSTQQILISNLNGADDGWVASISATNPTSLWESTSSSEEFDFNDPTTSGCADGADADSVAGQLTINPSAGSVATGTCSSCGLTGVSLGSSAAFSEGVTNSITVVSATSGSDDAGDWTIQGISLSQTIPASQPAYTDYAIDMTLSIVAS